MKRIAAVLAFSLVLAGAVVGQTVDCLQKNTPTDTFEVKGLASDEKGPLTKLLVIAFPYILPDNQPVVRFWLQDNIIGKDAGRKNNEFVYKARNEPGLTMNNPIIETDQAGAFTLKVPRGLFMVPCNCKGCHSYKLGEFAIGVFTEVAKGRWESNRELIRVTFDPNVSATDAGELSFKPAGPDN
ncbi:MAG TPA: hypothetical protein VJV05_11830 [Pyrinomonadaceae bacterium]|nr:hypothetical protein [Pyrinomonadaceae bacterium]